MKNNLQSGFSFSAMLFAIAAFFGLAHMATTTMPVALNSNLEATTTMQISSTTMTTVGTIVSSTTTIANVRTNATGGSNTTNTSASVQVNTSAQSTSTKISSIGTLQGRATVVCSTDSSTPPCTPLDLSTLGILIRQPTSQVQADGSTAVTVEDIKFNSNGTFSASLPAGTYYIYEDDNNWASNSTWTSTFTNPITISSGQTTSLNITVSKIKTTYPI